MTTSDLPCLNKSLDAPRSLGIVAVFDRPERAEAAVAALQDGGFDVQKLSIVARDAYSGEHLLGCATHGGRVRFWGRLGPTWSRLAGQLSGAAILFVPFIGHVVMLGAVLDWLIDDRPQHGTAEGATPLWRLLARIGVPSQDGAALEAALRECDIALLAHGEVDDARNLLRRAARTDIA